MNRITGRYERRTVSGEDISAFVPAALPPADPPLDIDADMRAQLARAEQELARLELAGEMVPSVEWFIYGFVRKEAVLSAQIEGTQATLMDLVNFEARGDDSPAEGIEVREVCNYLDALDYARAQLADPAGLPLSMRLLNETHARLMSGARGAGTQPGHVRRSQNWIGGTRPGNATFVPPPPESLDELLAAFERSMHEDDGLHPLIRAGLLHVQFETIHPYLDGNGRLGRLLVTLMLEHWNVLSQPVLYLSLFFKTNRDEYYRRLGAVRTDGDWEGWTRYFLEGVATIAGEAVGGARELFALINHDRGRVLAAPSSSVMAARLFEALPSHPVVSVAGAMELLETSRPTATKAITALVDADVLVESSGRKRDRMFGYAAYLEQLRAGTDTP